MSLLSENSHTGQRFYGNRNVFEHHVMWLRSVEMQWVCHQLKIYLERSTQSEPATVWIGLGNCTTTRSDGVMPYQVEGLDCNTISSLLVGNYYITFATNTSSPESFPY